MKQYLWFVCRELKNKKNLIKDNHTSFEKGFYDTVAAFVGSDVLEKYDKGTQAEIIETGSTIENVYWEEDIKIKEIMEKDIISQRRITQ